ncbi:MAG: hypothetical protein PHS66_07660 [Candidatus Omnitrophica bacterium]|nr:hypothetical protein [Candidatus Omnitrophota bacterium]
MAKQTSDERLLKIIEGSSEPRKAQVNILGVKKPLERAPAHAVAHLPAIKFNLASLGSMFKDLKFNLAKINSIIIGTGVFLTLVFIYILFSAPAISKSNASYFTPADSAAVVKFISIGQAQGLTRKNAGGENLRRNFFLPDGQKGSTAAAQENAEVLIELKDFKLVGIIWSKNPEVMIENAKDSRTYTLKKGDSFNEQFKIKEILRNSTILEVNLGTGTREYELR